MNKTCYETSLLRMNECQTVNSCVANHWFVVHVRINYSHGQTQSMQEKPWTPVESQVSIHSDHLD